MKASSNVHVKGNTVIADFKYKVIGASSKPFTMDCKGWNDQIMTRNGLKDGILKMIMELCLSWMICCI